MVDPVSLSVAATALLASKFGEGFAKDAGSSSWHAVGRLREVIARKLGHGSEISTAVAGLDENTTPQLRAGAAELIASAIESDPGFAHEVQLLVATARQDRKAETFIANAYDNAKQLNIHGGNSGTINFG